MNIKLKLPDGFLEEEVRCGYKISHEMKKVWAVELDLFAEFDRVCKKYDIKYCACGGTMLGAIRHNGFIPWDDDMDVMMLRNDYNRLCEVAAKEFTHPYFFQTEYTDRGSFRRHAQLRNSDTTGLLNGEDFLNINQGIFFDIFPLDNVVDNKLLFFIQSLRCAYYYKIALVTSCYSTRYVSSKNYIKRIIKDFVKKNFGNKLSSISLRYYKKYEMSLAKYNNKETKQVSQLIWDCNSLYHRDVADFRPLVEHDFEFLKIPVASNHEHALSKRFGEWRKFVVGGSLHGGVFFDTEKPYTEYLK